MLCYEEGKVYGAMELQINTGSEVTCHVSHMSSHVVEAEQVILCQYRDKISQKLRSLRRFSYKSLDLQEAQVSKDRHAYIT